MIQILIFLLLLVIVGKMFLGMAAEVIGAILGLALVALVIVVRNAKRRKSK